MSLAPRAAFAQSQHVLLTACNDTSNDIWVAVGERLNVLEDWPSHGWWKVGGGDCRYIGSYATNGEGFGLYAQASNGTYWGGTTEDETEYYCVDLVNAFTLSEGWRSGANADCPSGYALKGFRYIRSPSEYGEDQDFSYTYHFHM